ncbi:MAG TPA: 4Fe-4S binding protein [Sedimentisphaerales bacterium]|nr:4Fe-4S binding protein [Sedimentisphaerales bacterium]
MVLRNIVNIDEEKCDGCGQCVNACAEGAIQLVDGKAKLISEVYCDGLGACIGHCPQNAITVERRDVDEFNEQAVKVHMSEKKNKSQLEFVCPGIMTRNLRDRAKTTDSESVAVASQLSHWPVQLKLVSPQASYFANADLLLVADCVAFAMGDFHNKFLKGHTIVIGCPKLDDREYYIDKLAEILKVNKLRSLTVIHMEVPCCSGLTSIAREAIIRNNEELSFDDIVIDLSGNVIRTEKISRSF